jgi:hypothetical protein
MSDKTASKLDGRLNDFAFVRHSTCIRNTIHPAFLRRTANHISYLAIDVRLMARALSSCKSKPVIAASASTILDAADAIGRILIIHHDIRVSVNDSRVWADRERQLEWAQEICQMLPFAHILLCGLCSGCNASNIIDCILVQRTWHTANLSTMN